VFLSSTNPPSNYQGVTHITEDLKLGSIVDIAALDCLEIVDGGIDMSFTANGTSLAGAFPNLREVGWSIHIDGDNDYTIDACAFRSLEQIGTRTHTGAVDILGELQGEVDLRSLHDFFRIQFRNTAFRRVTLPSNGTFRASQLRIQGNKMLSVVTGLENAVLTGAGETGGDYSLYVGSNTLFPACRVEALRQKFLAAGYPEARLIIESNGPACP
jgi:hypothetical protein